MKIVIERTLSHQSPSLLCVVCAHPHKVSKSRSLLYCDQGLLQGDVCPKCMRLKTSDIQKKLRTRAIFLLEQSRGTGEQLITIRDRALELVNISQEPIRFPTLLQSWRKRMEIRSEEHQEMQAARLGVNHKQAKERSRLEQLLKKDKP